MPDRAMPDARICPDCDGFPTVAVTTGTRNQDGTRTTLPVVCPACHGTGHAPLWLVTTRRPAPSAPCSGYDTVGDSEACRRCSRYYADHPDYVSAGR